MPAVAITKMHGARNDFIVIDGRTERIGDWPALAIRLCDRHAGVGADGVLAIVPSTVADAGMRIFNADGSEAAMCGNGIRCVARYLDANGEGDALRIETASGVVDTAILSRSPYEVRAAIGAARVGTPVAVDGISVVPVDTGNSHAIIFVDDPDAFDLVDVGSRLQADSHFPGGTNVHALTVRGPQSIAVRHFERGVGVTMACGSGAVAAAAAFAAKYGPRDTVTVDVPGGTLRVDFPDGPGGTAFLSGPVERVFAATV